MSPIVYFVICVHVTPLGLQSFSKECRCVEGIHSHSLLVPSPASPVQLWLQKLDTGYPPTPLRWVWTAPAHLRLANRPQVSLAYSKNGRNSLLLMKKVSTLPRSHSSYYMVISNCHAVLQARAHQSCSLLRPRKQDSGLPALCPPAPGSHLHWF